MWFNRFQVKTRLLLFITFAIAAQIGIAAYAFLTVDKIRIGSGTYNEIKHYRDLYASAQKLENYLNSTRTLFVTMMFTENKDRLDQLRGQLEGYLEFVRSSFHATEAAVPDGDPEILSTLELAHFTWHEFKEALLEEFIPLMYSGDRERAVRLAQHQSLRLERFVEQVDSALNIINFRMRDIENEAGIIVARDRRYLYAVMGVSVMLLFGVALLVARSIIVPLGELSEAAKVLGKGDLSVRIAVSGRDELSGLALSLNHMAARLVETQELERKKAIESKKAADWENTFNSIRDLVSIQTTDLKYVRVNQAFLEAFDASPELVIGESCRRFFPDSDVAGEISPSMEVLKENRIVTREVVHPVNQRDYQVTISPLHNHHGEVVGLVHIAKDITEQKLQENITKKLQAELLHSQKMESIGTMANGIAHNLNNILAIIRGYVEMSLLDETLCPAVRDDLKNVVEAVDQAKELARNMLMFSRHQKLHVEPVKIQSVIQHGLKLFKGSMSCPLEICEHLEADDAVVLADANQIQQVLMNICNNAYHALESTQGKLEITLNEYVMGDDAIPKFSKLQAGEYVKLSLKDNGIGMSPETMSHIFEPFFTTKGVDKGTGLGLSTVHGIVKSHGGEITVESELGKGTEFTIYLPKVMPGHV